APPSITHGAVSFSQVKKSLAACFFRRPSCFSEIRSPGDWLVLILLSWCAKICHPTRMLESGGVNGPWLFPLISNQFPCMEITTIGKKMPNDDLLTFKPTTHEPLLGNFKGAAHFFYSDVDRALDRLKGMALGSFLFDLILFRPDIFDAGKKRHLDQALTCLNTKGILIVQDGDPQEFQDLWTRVEDRCPGWVRFAWPRYGVGGVVNMEEVRALPKGFGVKDGWEPPWALFKALGWMSRVARVLGNV
ncbi:MAG: hypothetical protein MI749_03820, partial [Desulfovibrionales bacterium]|nr:hypothetical protein [Desulfovibrionales bacterium]